MRVLLVLTLFTVVLAVVYGKSIISVTANVRGKTIALSCYICYQLWIGKKYDIKASTVSEVVQQVERLAGLTPGQQSVLFRGNFFSFIVAICCYLLNNNYTR